jgi:hypothetical protein
MSDARQLIDSGTMVRVIARLQQLLQSKEPGGSIGDSPKG